MSAALPYHLHPDDARVFNKAIAAANGQADPLKAAEKISDAEEALFSYSLAYHTNDVLMMLGSFVDAQCADDANVLTAMLRSVGIPAHPATADAAAETGDAGWNFDTWTEFLVERSGKKEWLVLHPHQYTSMSPEGRGVFGANRNVATKSFNDLVIAAGENWVWNEIVDSQADVIFSRNGCGEPKQHDLYKASWLIHLCEGGSPEGGQVRGYWNPNHWSCYEVGSRSFGLTASISINVPELTFGGPLAGTATLVSPREGALMEELSRRGLAVELMADLPESMAFPDEVLSTLREEIVAEPGETVMVDFEAVLPEILPAGYELYVGVRAGDSYVFVQELDLESRLRLELDAPGEVRVGEDVPLVVRLINRSERFVERIRVTTQVPPGLVIERHQPVVIDGMRSGEVRELVWEAFAEAPLEAGSIVVTAESANAGWQRAAGPIRIVQELETPAAETAVVTGVSR